MAVIGLYFYNSKNLFDVISSIKPSERGELEITDVNNAYIQRGQADFERVNGFWSDMGSLENRIRCSDYIGQSGRDKRIFYSLPAEDQKTFPEDVRNFFAQQ